MTDLIKKVTDINSLDQLRSAFEEVGDKTQAKCFDIVSSLPDNKTGDDGDVKLLISGTKFKMVAKINGEWKEQE